MDFGRRGWVKLPRDCIMDPLISKDAEYLATWVYLLTSAAFESAPALFGGRRIVLQPGQLVTGRKQISEIIGVTESKVQRILKAFENAQLIEQQTGNKNRLISIVSWDEMQSGEQQNERQMNSICTTDEQQMNTLEEIRVKNKKITYCAEPESSGSAPVITLPLNDKSEYPISVEQCHEWAGLYPAVDVMQQLRSMRGWLDANPTRRKTRSGIKRFITNWLSKEQNRAGRDVRPWAQAIDPVEPSKEAFGTWT